MAASRLAQLAVRDVEGDGVADVEEAVTEDSAILDDERRVHPRQGIGSRT
jgi:hypothetical protein